MANTIPWDGRAKGSTLGNRIFTILISLFGPLPAYVLLALVAWYYVFFDRAGTRALKEFGKRAGFTRTTWWHLFRHFYSFGMVLIDRYAFAVVKRSPYTFTFGNKASVSNVLDRGKGVIIISAHIGNWEVGGNMLANLFDTRINAIVVDNEQQEIKEVYKKAVDKRRFNTIVVSADGLDMMVAIKEALTKNEIICFHGDRTIGSSSIATSFLGDSALFPTGPFHIAAITGTPVIPVFLMKTGLYHFTAETFPPILIDSIDRQQRDTLIRQAVETYVSCLEAMAKKYPYQWYNFYSFWE